METLKYYKRGQGELDTSNFPEIAEQGELRIGNLDDRTLVSLMALNKFLIHNGTKDVNVLCTGYVQHLRGDKDVFPVAQLYDDLMMLKFICERVQHESTDKIKSASVTKREVLSDLALGNDWFTAFIGADGSVPKFFPTIDKCAKKVRKDGKVTGMNFELGENALRRIIIVDDILGGGATVQMLVDKIRASGFDGDLYLWVEYCEGIHKPEFLDQFRECHKGSVI